ncbi:MAG: response regulator [Verrucomicrobiota bacterium]
MSQGEPIEILMVEDNPADVRLAQEAFKLYKIKNKIHVAKNGVEALQFLNKEGAFAEMPSPDIILLDLNLPLKSGREVLEIIKEDSVLKRIPVVVLTTSEAEKDILHAYDHYANCYVSKPVDFDNFAEVIRKIEGFWFSVVKYPTRT